jgi:hypothetical protein
MYTHTIMYEYHTLTYIVYVHVNFTCKPAYFPDADPSRITTGPLLPPLDARPLGSDRTPLRTRLERPGGES